MLFERTNSSEAGTPALANMEKFVADLAWTFDAGNGSVGAWNPFNQLSFFCGLRIRFETAMKKLG